MAVEGGGLKRRGQRISAVLRVSRMFTVKKTPLKRLFWQKYSKGHAPAYKNCFLITSVGLSSNNQMPLKDSQSIFKQVLITASHFDNIVELIMHPTCPVEL